MLVKHPFEEGGEGRLTGDARLTDRVRVHASPPPPPRPVWTHTEQ